MYRKSEEVLSNWIVKENRKPLVIRGARQVGKSTLVRQFVLGKGLKLIEINCEQHPLLDVVFKGLNVTQILNELESLPGVSPIDSQSVLFLDEVQATPHALAALRYFYEQRPEIPVIAAGSLLEFTLSDHSFSMPVGRIEFLHMVPMDFEEFLLACGETKLKETLSTFTLDHPMSELQHSRFLELQAQYFYVGGMPEAVREFSKEKKLAAARVIHENLLSTYKAYFSKYGLKQDLLLLNRLLNQAAQQVTKRVKYSRLIPNEQSRIVRRLVDLLSHARLVSLVIHSDASDIPLRAEARDEVFKLLFLDVGLLNALLGLPWNSVSESAMSVRDGSVAEQFIGQELIATHEHGNQTLFYWLRDRKTNNAEIDFLIMIDGKIVPVEVKAGKSGTLRSLWEFCSARSPKVAVRFDINRPSLQNFQHSGNRGILISLPLYAASQLERIVALASGA